MLSLSQPEVDTVTGTVKYVGTLKTKGDVQYAGIELDSDYTKYGKNDGSFEEYAYNFIKQHMSAVC